MATPVTAPGRAAATSLCVEFLGLPGSGKSRIAAGLTEALRLEGLPAHEVFADWDRGRLERLRDHARAVGALAVLAPGVLAHGARLATRGLGGSPGASANLALQWLNRCGHLAVARRRPGIHLVDQGVYQVYWSMAFLTGADRVQAALPPLEAARPDVDVVVVVNAQEATVARRLRHRPGSASRLERAADEDAALERAMHALAFVRTQVDASARRDGPQVLEIANDADDEGAGAIAALAPRLLRAFASASRRGVP